MNIKPFDTVLFMREGVLMRCMAEKVEDCGVLVTYNVNGRAKLKALTLNMMAKHEPIVVESNHRWYWWLMILFMALHALIGIQFSKLKQIIYSSHTYMISRY